MQSSTPDSPQDARLDQEPRPAVTSIRFSMTRPRPKPQAGDRKVIKGVEYVRVMSRVLDTQGRVIGFNCTGGRQNYEWMPLDQALAKGFYRLPRQV